MKEMGKELSLGFFKESVDFYQKGLSFEEFSLKFIFGGLVTKSLFVRRIVACVFERFGAFFSGFTWNVYRQR